MTKRDCYWSPALLLAVSWGIIGCATPRETLREPTAAMEEETSEVAAPSPGAEPSRESRIQAPCLAGSRESEAALSQVEGLSEVIAHSEDALELEAEGDASPLEIALSSLKDVRCFEFLHEAPSPLADASGSATSEQWHAWWTSGGEDWLRAAVARDPDGGDLAPPPDL